jgi:hypothetical protein
MYLSLQCKTFEKHSFEGHTMWLFTSLSVQRPRFVPRASHVEFLLVKSSLEQVFLQACTLPQYYTSASLSYFIHLPPVLYIVTDGIIKWNIKEIQDG